MKINKQLILGITLAIFSISKLNAQAPNWNWTKLGGGTTTTARSACADGSGMYATGTFQSLASFDTINLIAVSNGVFIVKYTPAGVLSWAKMVKNKAFGALDSKSIAVDGSGNLYVTGSYTGTIYFGADSLVGGSDYLAKYDNNGNVQWAKDISGSNGVAVSSSGVYTTGGKSIQKYNAANGNQLWDIEPTANGVGYLNFYSIAVTSDDSVVVAGDINDSYTIGAFTVNTYQGIVMAGISSTGTVGWAKKYGAGTGGDHVQHICLDASNNLIMTGTVGDVTNFDGDTVVGNSGHVAYLIKFNAARLAQWATALTHCSGQTANFVAADATGNVYVTGGITGGAITNGSSATYLDSLGGVCAFVLKFDASGAFQSSLTNGTTTINNANGRAVVASSSGVYFAGVCSPGTTWGTTTAPGYGSVFGKIVNASATGIHEQPLGTNQLNVYPNPSNGTFSLGDFLLKNENAFLEMTDVNGKIVKAEKISSNQVDVAPLANGIYFGRLLGNNGNNYTFKLVKQ